MYYGALQECILNSETRDTQPELFVENDAPEAVMYFQGCTGQPATQTQPPVPVVANCKNALADRKCARFLQMGLCEKRRKIRIICANTCVSCQL